MIPPTIGLLFFPSLSIQQKENGDYSVQQRCGILVMNYCKTNSSISHTQNCTPPVVKMRQEDITLETSLVSSVVNVNNPYEVMSSTMKD